MKHYFLFLIAFGFSLLTHGQTAELNLNPVNKDYYAWITSLNEGPIKWLEEPEKDVEGEAYRICITTSEIYNSLYIEQVTFGMEGCCKKIVSKKELDLYKLFEIYQLTGEIANVEFRTWIDFKTFQLNIKGIIFTMDIEPDNFVKITRN